MQYHLVAIDYDGTLAEDGQVAAETLAVLERVKQSNRKLALVTGRELDDLLRIFPGYRIFDYIIAENGALIHQVETGTEQLLGHLPSQELIDELRNKGVAPLSTGKVIVATWEPHETTVLDVIKQSGLELQVIFNKGAVMLLPPGVNKASGLQALLRSLHLSPHNVMAIGDAENDVAMLETAQYAVAVNNALPSVKSRADLVTAGNAGAGVREILQNMLEQEPADRHTLQLGRLTGQQDFSVPAFGNHILLGGVSKGGKSTFAAAIAETLAAEGYQFCLIDPEGDYLELPETMLIGNDIAWPEPEETAELLKDPGKNLIVSMLSVELSDRPVYFNRLLTALLKLRAAYGRPHWLLIDEAHHLVPAGAVAENNDLIPGWKNFMLISTSPHALSHAWINQVNLVMAVGDNVKYVLEQYCTIKKCEMPLPVPSLEYGEACVWKPGSTEALQVIRYNAPKQLQNRHKRKYAMGDMGTNSFVFTGPGNKLQLKAHNLMLFVQMAEGIDEATWRYHAERKDFSRWLNHCLHDALLTEAAKEAEKYRDDVPHSKNILLNCIKEKYIV